MKEEGFEFKYLLDNDEEGDQDWKDDQEKYNIISSEILAGGYKIYTSFDSNLQNQVQGIVDNTLSGYQDTVDGKYNQQAAVVTVDNDKIQLQIKLFNSESTMRYLEKLERRSGHTFKKMIESYEQNMANQG